MRVGAVRMIEKTAPALLGKSEIIEYMTMGIVLKSGIPTRKVPCASSSEFRKVNTDATKMPGMASGSVMLRNTRKGEAPTSRADSSWAACTLRKAAVGIHVINIRTLIM